MVNRSKKGEILHKEIALAQSNAIYAFKNPEYAKKHYISGYGTEKYYLTELINKATSRLKQIEEKV